MKRHDPGVEVFDRLVAELRVLLDRLRRAPAAKVADQQPIPKGPGLYLFSESTNRSTSGRPATSTND
jgi:hypothetical protein